MADQQQEEDVEYEEVEVIEYEEVEEEEEDGQDGDGELQERQQQQGPGHAPPSPGGSSTGQLADVPLGTSPLVAQPAPEAAAANPGVARPSSQGDLVLVEQQASKVAAEVAQAASQLSLKLQGGLLTALAGGGGGGGGGGGDGGAAPAAAAQGEPAAEPAGAGVAAAAAAAAAGFGVKLSGGLSGLSSWWQGLDESLSANNTPLAPPGTGPEDKLARAAAAEQRLAALFGLGPSEAVVEGYRCSLLQTYAPADNHGLTPPMRVAFEGTLHVTERHLCFQGSEQQQQQQQQQQQGAAPRGPPAAAAAPRRRGARAAAPVAFRVALADVASATREPHPGATLAAADALQVAVRPGAAGSGPVVGAAGGGGGGGGGGGWTVRFHGFDPPGGLDAALALVEHLREGA